MDWLSPKDRKTTTNPLEADCQIEQTNWTLPQYLQLYTRENSSGHLNCLSCAAWICNTTVRYPTRYSLASYVHIEALLPGPMFGPVFESQPHRREVCSFYTQLVTTQECMKKSNECHTRNWRLCERPTLFFAGCLCTLHL